MNSAKHKNVILIFLAFVALLLATLSVSVVGASGGQAASQAHLLAITPTPMRNDAFTFCAFKGGTCTVPGTKSVRYGTSDSYVVKTVTNSIPCTDAAFGVLLNKVPKDCRYITMPIASEAKWTSCAFDRQTCLISTDPVPTPKLVRYGANNAYVYQVVSSPSIICSPQAFGGIDPIPNVVKECLFIDQPTVGGTIWTQCAVEGGQCFTNSTPARAVAYGYAPAAAFHYKSITSSTACTAAAFSGDPYPGAAKTCYIAPVEWSPSGWILCSNDNGTCHIQGSKTVAYGEGTSFTYKNVTRTSIACNSSSFSVPASGTPRACYYNITYGE